MLTQANLGWQKRLFVLKKQSRRQRTQTPGPDLVQNQKTSVSCLEWAGWLHMVPLRTIVLKWHSFKMSIGEFSCYIKTQSNNNVLSFMCFKFSVVV